MAKKKLLPIAKDMPSPMAITKTDKKDQDRWRAEDDLRTIQRYQEVCADKSRMSAVKQIAAEQKKALEKVVKHK